MISISVYRHYTPPVWATRPVSPPPRQKPQERPRGPAPGAPRQEPVRPSPPRPEKPERVRETGLQSLLPAGIDTGDLFLAAMLLFLYSESRDEDFLIILIVVGLSMFRKK